jgi:hypothetical protein
LDFAESTEKLTLLETKAFLDGPREEKCATPVPPESMNGLTPFAPRKSRRFCLVVQRRLLILVRRIDKTDEPVLAPTFIASFGTNGIRLSPTSAHLDSALRYTPTYQRLLYPVGTTLGEPKIVEPIAPRRCVSVDVETDTGMILQPLNIAFENVGIRRIIVVVVRKQDDLHVLVKSLFFGTEHNDWWPGPMIDPISDISLWFCGS